MNAFSRLIIASALMMLAAPAFAATEQAHIECDADDVDRNVAGCGLAEGNTRGPSYDVRHAPIAGRANPKFSRSVVPE
jgi:hypothetical protein